MRKAKIAVINPELADGLARTVIDGLFQMSKDGSADFRLSSRFKYSLSVDDKVMPQKEFMEYAKDADCIFLIYCQYGFGQALAEKIGLWEKTVFIDGSELGKNNRLDFSIQNKVIENGGYLNDPVDRKMLAKCAAHFKREKPYFAGAIPLPFGIESKYIKYQEGKTVKDIDFFCVFGQDEYPLLRRFAREQLEKFCKREGFTFHTEKTSSNEEFYLLLARSKVGISVGGGGYDSMRFWEILANDCLLLTERIDIYEPGSKRLDYERIWQFNNLFDLTDLLMKMGNILKSSYKIDDLQGEYVKILKDHSSEARVKEILDVCNKKGIIKSL